MARAVFALMISGCVEAAETLGGSEWHPLPWPAVEIGPFVVPPVWTGDEALFYEGTFSRFWSYLPDPTLLTSSS